MKDSKFEGADDSTIADGHIAVCMGRRLLPLSLWHMWLLRSMENPYAVGGIPEGQDLCELVFVCSMTRKGFARATNRHAGQITEQLVGRFFLMDADDRTETVNLIHEYLESQTDVVEFWQAEDSDPIKDRMRCPPEWHLILDLLKARICETEDDAWDYPYARAMAWRAVITESQTGSREYIDPLDREQIDVVNNANN